MLITLIYSGFNLQKKKNDLKISKNKKKQIFNDVKTYLKF